METDDEEDLLEVESKDNNNDLEDSNSVSKIVPRRPGPCRAKAGDGKATLWWTDENLTAKDSDDTEELFSKTEVFVIYKYRLDGEEWIERGAHSRVEVNYPTTSVTLDGLSNGRKYQFSVRARDRKGRCSKESVRSNTVIPFEPLPEPWTEHYDTVNGKTYYYNPETKQRTWIRPTENIYKVGAENKERFHPREIAKLRLRFVDVDTDDSGQIDEGELVELMKELDCPISRPRARKMIRKVDSDGSGKIEFDEFLTMMWKFRHGQLDGFQDFFKKMVNGSVAKGAAEVVMGKLKDKMGEGSRVEKKHQLQMMEKMRMGKWEERFDEVKRRKFYFNKETKEKRWRIPDEVLWFVPEDLARKFTESELDEIQEQFARFDEDNSGEMDVDELTEAMRALGDRRITHKRVLSLIKEVDFDNSGQVNFAEFVHLLDLRRERSKGIQFSNKLKKVIGNVTQGADAGEVKRLKAQVFEAKQENKYLRAKVETLHRENKFLRSKKFVFIPVIPIKDFLESHHLDQYHEACASFGILDTADLYRLEEEDFEQELGFKLGHKRKIIAALKRMEEKMDTD